MNSMGYSINGIALKPSKVSSETGGKINNEQLVSSSNFNYDTSKWSYENSSMEDTSETSVSAPPDTSTQSECPSSHRSGVFEYPDETDYMETTVYSVKLDGSSTDCNVYGVDIDKNNDGKIEENEKTFLDGERTEIKGRMYEVRIFDHDHVRLVYVGEEDLEYFNFRQEFKDQDISKFGRIPEVNENSSRKKIALLSSSLLYLLEGENSFGMSGESSVSTTTTLPSERGVYTVNTRWHR
jgi:hypothetical protein